jgi:hypothetical protein
MRESYAIGGGVCYGDAMVRTPAMKPRARVPRAAKLPALDGQAIDALYGLEPVFEPSASAPASAAGAGANAGAAQFIGVQCPYCAEAFETLVDLSAGASVYIEDCQICCQPIELQVELTLNGALAALTAQRTD